MTRFFSRLRAKVSLIVTKRDGRKHSKHGKKASESAAEITVEEDDPSIVAQSSSMLEEMEKMNAQVEEERRKSFMVLNTESSSSPGEKKARALDDSFPIIETNISTDDIVEDWDTQGAQIQHASAEIESMMDTQSHHTTASMLEEMERMNAQLEAEQKKIVGVASSSPSGEEEEKKEEFTKVDNHVVPIPEATILEQIEKMNAQYELERSKSKSSLGKTSVSFGSSFASDDDKFDVCKTKISEGSICSGMTTDSKMNNDDDDDGSGFGSEHDQSSPTSTGKSLSDTIEALERMNAQFEADRRKSAMFHEMQASMSRLIEECDLVEEECYQDEDDNDDDESPSSSRRGHHNRIWKRSPPHTNASKNEQQNQQILEDKDAVFPDEEMKNLIEDDDSEAEPDDSLHMRSLLQTGKENSILITGKDETTKSAEDKHPERSNEIFRNATVPKFDKSSKTFDESTASLCAELLLAEKIREMNEAHAHADGLHLHQRHHETGSSFSSSVASESMRDLSIKISEMERMNSMIETERRLTENLIEVERMNELIEAAQLAEFLEAMNTDLNEELVRSHLRQQALDATMKLIQEHFDQFIHENPNGSYEEWIEELHPENAQSRRHIVNGRNIDHRFYVEESDHRKLWNANLGDGARQHVRARTYNDSEHFTSEELSSLL